MAVLQKTKAWTDSVFFKDRFGYLKKNKCLMFVLQYGLILYLSECIAFRAGDLNSSSIGNLFMQGHWTLLAFFGLYLLSGESTEGNHFSLYGYPRAATPHLNEYKESLIPSTDVISGYAHTDKSCFFRFTTEDKQHPDDYRYTMLDVFNERNRPECGGKFYELRGNLYRSQRGESKSK